MPREVAEISVGAVKEWLMRYQAIERMIDNEIERFETLEARLQTISSPRVDDMPRASPIHDRMGTLIAQKQELKEKIRHMIREQTDLRYEIERFVDHLQKADEKAVVLMRYVDGEQWKDISMMLFGSKQNYLDSEDSYLRRVTKLHGRALQDLTEIMKENCPADILQDDPQDCL